MKMFLLCVLSVLSLCVCSVALADGPVKSPNGVLAQERIVNLPKDQNKWYVSVVGDSDSDAYRQLDSWFSENEKLKSLKDQVFYCPVTTDNAIYKDRYEHNVKGLPTIRVQEPNGIVVYEASGDGIPMTAEGLYSAIAKSANAAQGIRPLLPWRRKMEKNCNPRPNPNPSPVVPPVPFDSEPQPLDNGGAPSFDQETQTLQPVIIFLLSVLSTISGATIGLAVQWRQTYAKA